MYYFKNGTLTNLDTTLEQVAQDIKSKLITYMLINHNIPWLNDETEKHLYDILFDFLEPLICGKVLSENSP